MNSIELNIKNNIYFIMTNADLIQELMKQANLTEEEGNIVNDILAQNSIFKTTIFRHNKLYEKCGNNTALLFLLVTLPMFYTRVTIVCSPIPESIPSSKIFRPCRFCR